ncbi:MAG: hypothetical protein JSV54_08555 [Chloroflexota bacterium]|nr:MAG: hypothetical protein JSV54_08555 [Chloroflexota bacterium]
MIKVIAKKRTEVDQSSVRHIEVISRFLWPWRETLLLVLVGFLTVIDFISTYVALDLSGNKNLYEGGLLANWALRTGGFAGLLLFDIAATITLLLVVLTIRLLYSKFGYKDFGRTAFVLILAPHVVITVAAIFNNVVLTFL